MAGRYAVEETGALRPKIQSWSLAKYDGDPPKEGEVKAPVEIIEGGAEQPTVRKILQPDGSYLSEVIADA
jgi:hypothetical protein